MSRPPDPMAPEASPLALAKPAGVRRVNNRPLVLIGAVLGAFLLIMAWVAADRAAKPEQAGEGPKTPTGSTVVFAQEIAGGRAEGLVAPAVSEFTAPAAEPLRWAETVPPETPFEAGRSFEPPTEDGEAARLRRAKLERLEAAAKASTGVPVVAPRSAGSPLGHPPPPREQMLAQLAQVRQRLDERLRDDPTAAYHARLAELQGRSGGGTLDAPSPMLVPTAAAGDPYAAFDTSGEQDRWRLEAKPEPPRTPYTLRAGFVIPATLISGIHSELPGPIMAQVAHNVYDTPTGRYRLIPQGARLVGRYASDVAYGQSRVLVAWQRIVFPDGKALDLGAMPGADSAGYAGFHDRVDHHYLRVFGSALLMSAVVAGITLSQDDRASDPYGGRQRASDALSEALGQQLGQVTAQLIAKNLNIAPTLEIRPGYRFNVIATQDLTFAKPYQAFDY